MMIATGIGSNEGSKLYDLQLVPYCPLVQRMSVEKEFTVADTYLYSFVYSQDAADSQATPKVAAVIFNVPSSNFKTQVKYPITVINKKMDNETKVYRLNSPNYNVFRHKYIIIMNHIHLIFMFLLISKIYMEKILMMHVV